MKEGIVLTGFMGTGKTSAGKLIAEMLHLDFIDIDEEIKKRCSMSISAIFENYGEKYFRKLESDMVREIFSLDNYVISTGGGIVLNFNNMRLLRERGTVLWLKASFNTILHHLKKEKPLMIDRPLLRTANMPKRIEQLMQEREPYYAGSCDYMIRIDGMSLLEVTHECIHIYRNGGMEENGKYTLQA
ncbi:MAG: shikimate kinase [bacterium]